MFGHVTFNLFSVLSMRSTRNITLFVLLKRTSDLFALSNPIESVIFRLLERFKIDPHLMVDDVVETFTD